MIAIEFNGDSGWDIDLHPTDAPGRYKGVWQAYFPVPLDYFVADTLERAVEMADRELSEVIAELEEIRNNLSSLS